jgi:hypothetical protein
MVGPPCSAKLYGGFLCPGHSLSAAHDSNALGISVRRKRMDGTLIVVIVLVGLFLAAMIAFQVYINGGKDEKPEKHADRRP